MRRRTGLSATTVAMIVLLVVAFPVAIAVWRSVRRSQGDAALAPSGRPARIAAGTSRAAVPSALQPCSVEPAGRTRRRRLLTDRPPWVSVSLVCFSLLVMMGLPTTWATFNDEVTMAPVTAGAGTVHPPSALAASQTPTAARVSWTPPATGITPDAYDVFRSTTAGTYPAAPLGSSSASPYDDATAAECVPYFYKARSSRVNLDSVISSSEASITVDRTAPVVSTGSPHVYYHPAPLPKIADFIRVSPGGNIEAYAQVSDNCSPSGSGIAVSFAFGAPLNSTVSAAHGSYQPVAGGPTYNYKWGPYALPAGSLTHGQSLSWTVQAIDPAGNVATQAGTPATGDGQGPSFDPTRPAEIVSGATNYYDLAQAQGEIVSGASANTVVKSDGFWTYANVTDSTGVSSVTADVANLRTGADAVPMVSGSYSTDNGAAWGWRAPVTVPDTTLADGVTSSGTITAVDVLGNVSTNVPSVEIDNSPIAAVTCANGGNGSGTLNVGDTSTWTFGTDTIDPPSIKAVWTSPPFTASATATLASGTRDYFNLNGSFGLDMFVGPTYNESWNLAASNWTTGDFAASTFSIAAYNQTQLAYGSPSVVVSNRNRDALAYISTSVRNAAGLQVVAPITTAGCSTSAW